MASMRLRLIFSVGVRHPLLIDHGSRGSCRHRENVRVALACGEKEPVSELPRRLNADLGKAAAGNGEGPPPPAYLLTLISVTETAAK